MDAFHPDQEAIYLGDPHAHHRRLRRADPVTLYDGAGGLWCLLEHGEVAAVSLDPRRFTSKRGTRMPFVFRR